MKFFANILIQFCKSRSPHGECGLKSIPALVQVCALCRSPHGECGLKCRCHGYTLAMPRRSPHGECGLKYLEGWFLSCPTLSLPAWGVWIEIVLSLSLRLLTRRRSPHGECGLKWPKCLRHPSNISRPAWGVWIEMSTNILLLNLKRVAPRMGSVD